MKVPPLTQHGFEHNLLRMVSKIRQVGPEVAIIVLPQERRQAQTALWIHKWNRIDHVPFVFTKSCVCRLGSTAPGFHFTVLLGKSYGSPGDFGMCEHVPCSGCQPLVMQRCLSECVMTLARILSGSLYTAPAATLGSTHACERLSVPGSQRTPDSEPLTVQPDKCSGSSNAEAAPQISKDVSAYPTASREKVRDRRNRMKAAGIEIVVKKKKFVVEDHHDDCGDDLSSLGPVDETMLTVGLSAPYTLDSDEERIDQDFDRRMVQQLAYPITYPIDPDTVKPPAPGGVPGKGRDPRAAKPDRTTCPSCRQSRAKDDWEHTREIGQCAYPYDMPFLPSCDACQRRKGRLQDGHSYIKDRCRWGPTDATQLTRAHRPRTVPHEPPPRPNFDPIRGAPATTEGRELGQDAEEEVEEGDRRAIAERPMAPEAAPTGGGAGSGHQAYDEPPEEGENAEPGEAAPRQGRGPDQQQRVRRTYRDVGANPERPDDWTNFDIGRVVRLFRTDKIGAIRLSLRKLHVRWWHASHHTMRRMLERCGVADHVLQMIPEVCQTCTVCREWAKPGPSNASNVEIADTFNTQVECDLIFIHKYIIFHMIDRCTRWHAAKLITDKKEETLTQAIDELWVSTHGAMKELILDGESGIAKSEYTNQYLARKGIHLHVRGKDQHARFIERRGALLRDQIHRVEGQLKEEGIEMPFHSILAESVFSGNALLSINGSSPYNAVYGRVPQILPGIDQVRPPGDDREPATFRHAQRLREVSVQAIVEGSARARLGRTTNTRTTASSSTLNLQVGEEIDFIRQPGTKDTSGWYGPATVVDISKAARGVITLRFQNQVTEAMVQNVRRHLHFLTYLAAPIRRAFHATSVWDTIAALVEKQANTTTRQFGHIWHQSGWVRAAADAQHPGWFHAVVFYAENHLHINPVVSARIGRGLRKLPAIRGYSGAVTILWRPGQGHTTMIEQEASKDSVVDCLRIAQDHPDWQSLRVLQLLLSYEDMALARESPPETGGRNIPETSHGADSGHLETITEESEASTMSPGSATEYLVHEDPEWQSVLLSLQEDWTTVLEDAPPCEEQGFGNPLRLPLEYLQQTHLDMSDHLAYMNQWTRKT